MEGLAQFSAAVTTQGSTRVNPQGQIVLQCVANEGAADWVNHSCDPNAGLVGQIVLVALRDIKVGEEICFDYATSDGSPYDEFECGCGSRLCRHHVTGDDWKLPELQKRYEGHFSPYIQRRIDGHKARPAASPRKTVRAADRRVSLSRRG